jgi:hypothetical protein
METTETKSAIQTAAKETTESARKVGEKLRTLAGGATDSAKRWGKRCGEMLSKGARLTTLQANQRVLQTKLDRTYRELGCAVYAVHGKEEHDSLAGTPEIEAALRQVEEAESSLNANGAELAALRDTGRRGDSPSP